MPGLMDTIRRQISVQGPLTVAQYMGLCLTHPEHGYYRKSDPLGRSGDFVTAPEISQMFGELIGLWAVAVWRQMGAPGAVRLVELGPGRGTLMADALRAAGKAPGFAAAAELHLVETSPALRAVQEMHLNGFAPHWHESVGTLPDGPRIVIANEFFDALPIRQFERSREGWRERMVGLNEAGEMAFVRSPLQIVNPLVPDSHKNAPPGAIVEICPAALNIVQKLSGDIKIHGGAVLLTDYGHDGRRSGDTFQAAKNHQYCAPLASPGDADLTAHVDFGATGRAANSMGARAYGPIGQGGFLTSLGIQERAAALRKSAPPDQRAQIDADLSRLTAPDQMGELFQAQAITHPDAPVPPGFEAA